MQRNMISTSPPIPPSPSATSPHLSISCQTSHLDEIRYCGAACRAAYQTSLGLIAPYDSHKETNHSDISLVLHVGFVTTLIRAQDPGL